ncbi:MAG: dTDP-4-amino-4,6-dideoxygalactose transaminase [Lentisphaeria bacterium]
MHTSIPFNRPFIAGKELYYMAQAVQKGHLAGDGQFTKKCNAWMEERFQAHKVLLTHSCTAALEMAALLAEVGPGDEVIMPSYTFVSTANAFALRGAAICFVDIRPDTLNIDETKIEAAITPKTKAIVPVHYAGVACQMNVIMEIAAKHNLLVIEDAAQGVNATFNGRYLGTIGHLGCYSFHETKNFISGEGGALVINDPRFVERAEILREKGTNRSRFFRGEVDKYTWVDIGSSYLPSELIAAFLYAQLEQADEITRQRHAIHARYATGLQPLADAGHLRLPQAPPGCEHNAHMFYIITNSVALRTQLLAHLKQNNIQAVFHYVPLHTSPMGRQYGCRPGDLPVTEELSERLIRLPCYYELCQEDQDVIIGRIKEFFVHLDR